MPTSDEIQIAREKKLSVNHIGGQIPSLKTGRPSKYDKPGAK